MPKTFNILINVGLALFLIWTSLLVFSYFALLADKIVKPQYKNMTGEQTIYFGLLAIVFIALDVLIIRRFIRLLRRSSYSEGSDHSQQQ
jgi:hypothetical protein